MEAQQENKPDNSYLVITIVLAILYLASAFNPQFLHALQSKKPTPFPQLLQIFFVFILPIAIFLFYRRNKTAYKALLLYLPYCILSNADNSARMMNHPKEPSTYLPLLCILISALALILLLQKNIRHHFDMDGRSIAGVIISSVFITAFTMEEFYELRFIIFLFPFLLFAIIPVWDWKLYRANKSDPETSLENREAFRTKFKITLLPFLVLIPAGLVIQVLQKNNLLSSIAFLVAIVLPAVLANRWLDKERIEKPFLDRFATNYRFTLAFHYFILFILLMICAFMNMGPIFGN